MATPGYVFRDGGAIPDCDLEEQNKESGSVQPGGTHASGLQQEQQEQQPQAGQAPRTPVSTTGASSSAPRSPNSPPSSHQSKPAALATSPTDSHALAAADHEEKGVAQQEHFETEVKDLGWTEPKEQVTSPLVGGIENEELWLLVRRFNKQMYHVKATNEPLLAGLDLNIADEDEFSPDKLRANVERLYMTVIVGLIGFGKHIARLRSWREPRRTGAFAAAYFVAWIFDFVMPLLFSTITVLILVPQTRTLLFPPAPIALINSKTGGVQSPKAGVLGSHDSVTGAPENHKGEAVEQEASNFVAGIGTIAVSSATGKHETDDSDSLSASAPDPTKLASAGADAKSSAQGQAVSKSHDKTKQPMEDAMWTQMRPVMHIIGDIADGWERFANALSPTRPFSLLTPKLKLASVIAPGIAVAMATSPYMFTKLNVFFVGFGFFGDPVIQRGATLLNEKFPNWQKLLELRNSILKGVPTNSQLTITLLRIGEANKAPLPPPPTADGAPPNEAADLDHDELTVDASHGEIQDAIHPDEDTTDHQSHPDEKKKKKGAKVLEFLKGTTKGGVETKLGADNIRAAVGSGKAKDHLGAVPKPKDLIRSGPVDFKGRYKGTKGWVYINTSATIPCVGFSKHQTKGTGEETDKALNPVFSIPIADIAELKKSGGFGWKAKLVIGWATDKNVVGGLEIVDKTGHTTRITAIVLRDELFNRLVAMGGQKWVSW